MHIIDHLELARRNLIGAGQRLRGMMEGALLLEVNREREGERKIEGVELDQINATHVHA